MPIIKSAIKRARQETVRRARNDVTKRAVKQEYKTLVKMVETKDKKVQEQLNKVQSTLDTAVKKNIIHKNKAARKKASASKLAKSVK